METIELERIWEELRSLRKDLVRETKMGALQADLDTTDQRHEAFTERVEAYTVRVDRLAVQVGEVAVSLGRLEHRIDELARSAESRIGTLERRLDGARGGVGAIPREWEERLGRGFLVSGGHGAEVLLSCRWCSVSFELDSDLGPSHQMRRVLAHGTSCQGRRGA